MMRATLNHCNLLRTQLYNWISKPVLAVLFSCLVLVGCSSTHLSCSDGEQRMVNEYLYFGTARSDGPDVSITDWDKFLDESVTPRFPDGLSHWPISGQWRGTGETIKEDSHILNILRPDSPDADSKITEIVDLYKAEFGQESVLRVKSAACVSF